MRLSVVAIVIVLAVGCAGPVAPSPLPSPSPTAATATQLPSVAPTPSAAVPTPAPTPSPLVPTPAPSPSPLASPSQPTLPSPIASPTPIAPSPNPSPTIAPTPTASPTIPALELADSDVLWRDVPTFGQLDSIDGTSALVAVPHRNGTYNQYDLRTGEMQHVPGPTDTGWRVTRTRTPLGVVSSWLKPAAWGWGTPGCWSAPFEWRITYRSFAGGTRVIAQGVDRYARSTPWIDEICADPFGGGFEVDPEGRQIVYAIDLSPQLGLRRPERLIVENLESGRTVRTILASGPFWGLDIDHGRVAWTEIVTNVPDGRTKAPRLMLAEPGRRPIEVSAWATDVWLAADRITWRQNEDRVTPAGCYSGRLRQLALGPRPADATAALDVTTADACPWDAIQDGGDLVWVEDLGEHERVMALTEGSAQPVEIRLPSDLIHFADDDGNVSYSNLSAGGGWVAVQVQTRIVAFPLSLLGD